MSCLSAEPDGSGFYYGFTPGDPRRIDVSQAPNGTWVVHVAGELVSGGWGSLAEAEEVGVAWIRMNPRA